MPIADAPSHPSSRRAAPPPAPSGGIFEVLRLRNYRLFWLGNFFSSTSIWIQATTMGWVAYDITGSATILGSVGAMRAIPTFLLAPAAGVLADRVDRRRYMMVIQFLQALLTFGMAVGLALHQITLLHLFLFSFISATLMILLMPVQSTLVFDIVPRRLIPNAIPLSMAVMNLTQVFGPSLAGFLIAALGAPGNFSAQSVAYLAGLITIAMIVIPPRRGEPSGDVGFLKNLGSGLRYVSKQPTIRLLLLIGFIQPLLIGPVTFGLMPVIAKDIFHRGPQGLGILLSALGVGGFFGAFTAATWQPERRGLLQVGALALTGVTFLLFSFSRSFAVALPLLVLGGFCQMIFQVSNQTVLQLTVPNEMRGRISGLFGVQMGIFPLSGIIAGALTDLSSAPFVVAVDCSLAIALAVGLLLFAPSLRRLRMTQMMNAVQGPDEDDDRGRSPLGRSP